MRVKSLAQLSQLLYDPDGVVVDHSETHVDELIEFARRIKESLRQSIGCEFKLEFEGQDRSDFAQLQIPSSMLKNPEDRWVEIRLSNRAPLVAISEETKVPELFIEVLKNALEGAGCIVVDQQVFIPETQVALKELKNGCVFIDLWYSLFDYD